MVVSLSCFHMSGDDGRILLDRINRILLLFIMVATVVHELAILGHIRTSQSMDIFVNDFFNITESTQFNRVNTGTLTFTGCLISALIPGYVGRNKKNEVERKIHLPRAKIQRGVKMLATYIVWSMMPVRFLFTLLMTEQLLVRHQCVVFICDMCCARVRAGLPSDDCAYLETLYNCNLNCSFENVFCPFCPNMKCPENKSVEWLRQVCQFAPNGGDCIAVNERLLNKQRSIVLTRPITTVCVPIALHCIFHTWFYPRRRDITKL